MIKPFVFTSAVLMMAFVFPGSAFAQRCDTDYELIFELRQPEFGSYNVWDFTYGQKNREERFISGLALSYGVLVVGERLLDEQAGVDEILLAAVDRRGRTAWEKVHEVQDLKKIVKMLPHKDGYVVLGNQHKSGKRAQIWLGFFNEKGELTGQKTIQKTGSNLKAYDIIRAHDGKNYMVAASFQETKPGSRPYAIIYKIDPKGKVLDDHGYLAGAENGIYGLATAKSDHYIATGYMYDESSRKIGWIMTINQDGGIVWQQEYPRGRAAELYAAQEFLHDFVVVAGDASPAGDDNTAGWVMLVNATNGSIGWQRYYTGDLNYHGRGISVSEDNLISVMLKGKTLQGSDLDSFTRILTLNPRGAVHASDEYFNAEGVHTSQMILGAGNERVLVGSTDAVYQIESQGAADEVMLRRSLDGLVIGATPAESYSDPCLEAQSFLP